MKLSEVTANYVAHKQSMGMRFRTEARTLKSFCRTMGEVNIQQVRSDRVQAYLAGTGPVTRFWERKHNILDGFYRFAIARGYVASTPLPRGYPKPLQPFVPYIYILLAAPDRQTAQGRRDYALLLFLYNSGARATEAAQLKVRDLDMHAACVKITGKGGKQRLCPLWPATIVALEAVIAGRERICLRQSPKSSDHSIRNPHSGRALCAQNMRQVPGAGDEAGKPSFHSPQHRNPSPPCGR
jgi:integrase/recombinase XerD